MSGHSEAYRRFVDSFAVVDRASREDYDVEALLQLDPSEREQAEDLLIATVEGSDDPRAPRALAYLRCTRALPALRAAATGRHGEMAVEAALAVHDLAGDESMAAPIVAALGSDDGFVRAHAAQALGAFTTPDAQAALVRAIDDPDKLVRANAVESVMRVTGLAEWDTVTGRGIGLLGMRLRSRFSAVRAAAVDDLQRLAAAKREGRTREELGVPVGDVERSEAAQRLQRSLVSRAGSGPWAQDYDLDALTDIDDPGEREWAVQSLYFYLDRGDFRAARALLTVRAPHAADAFRELVGETSGRLGVEVAWGLWVLTRDERGRAVVQAETRADDPEVRERAAEVLARMGSTPR